MVILGHFLPFTLPKTPKIKILKNEKICWRYHHFTHMHQKSQSYDVQFLRYRYKIFVILGHFLPFYFPPNDPKYQNFEKMKKMAGDIILLYMCTINEDNIIYGSWNIRCDSQKFLTFWVIFCLFNPFTTWKIKILTLKKALGDIILHIFTTNDNHMMYGS